MQLLQTFLYWFNLLGYFDDKEKVVAIRENLETAHSKAEHSECILLKPSYIDSILLWLLEDDVKAAGNAALGESEDVEAVLGVELEEYEV